MEEGIEVKNRDLDELLEFYDAYDLLPFANHVTWLSAVKEVLGYIPFKLDYFTIRCLVILKEEASKKTVKDSQEMTKKAESVRSSVPSGGGVRVPVGIDRAILKK